jgi:hypothetical protein
MCVTDVFNEGMNYAWKKRAGGKEGRGERVSPQYRAKKADFKV